MEFNLKEFREDQGWTQGQIAKALGQVQGNISYMEARKTAKAMDDLGRYLKAMDCRAVIEITLPSGVRVRKPIN